MDLASFLDISLFSISIVQILRNRLAFVVLAIVFLFQFNFFLDYHIKPSIPFAHNVQDTGFILFYLMLIRLAYRKRRYDLSSVKNIKVGVCIFLAFWVIALSVDLITNNVNPISTLKQLRNWSVLLLIFYVDRFYRIELHRFLNYLTILAVFFSIIYIIEFLFNVDIIGAPRSSSRAHVPPWLFIVPYILLLCDFFRLKSWQAYLLASVFIVELVLNASRTAFIAYAVATMFTFLFNSSVNLTRKILIISVVTSAIILLFSTDNVLSQRFDEGASDVSTLETEEISKQNVSGNFSFRVLLFEERRQYINQSIQRIVFGIGAVHEKDFPTTFRIGLPSKDRPGPVQLDTADMGWTLLLLRLGYVGTIIYLAFIIYPMMKLFFVNRRNIISYALLIYLFVEVVFITFSSVDISTSTFWLVPYFSLVTVLPHKEKFQ